MIVRKQLLRLGVFGCFAFASLAAAQTQTFNYTIPAVDVIAASGAATINLTAPAAGAVFAVGSSSTTTLAFTTNNGTLRNITAALDSAMPIGTQLVLKPSGGTRTTDNLTFTGGTTPAFVTSATLTTTAARLVTGTGATGGFKQVAYTGVTLTYELTASLEATPQITNATRTITFTVIAN